ncbi:hypothetical protein J3A83DRAFT_4398682, partial [Scleroderma citrinum]
MSQKNCCSQDPSVYASSFSVSVASNRLQQNNYFVTVHKSCTKVVVSKNKGMDQYLDPILTAFGQRDKEFDEYRILAVAEVERGSSILKKNREIAPRSSNEGIRSQETVSTSETSSIFTKGKSKLHRFRTSILPNSIPKEVITHDERTGIVVHEQGQGQASELGGPANAATDEGLPALLQHGPTVVVAENAMVVVHQTFTASAHPSDVPVQQDKVPAIAISTVSGNDQVIQTGVNDMYDAEKKTLTIESIPRPAEYAVTAAGLADTAMTHLNTINATSLQPLTTF